MTAPIDDPEIVRRILANTKALLLDFDGPICSVFAGIPASVVAGQLRAVLADGGHFDLPDEVQATNDPFDVLFYAAELGPDEARYVEASFRAHEIEAVQVAKSNPNSIDLMRAWNKTGRPLAVVSNNSATAVATYLDLHDLGNEVDLVSARVGADIHLLKPNPFLVSSAVRGLAVPATQCVLIGDSVTDIQAAKAAAVKAVGYANRAAKIVQFAPLGPSVIITDRTYAAMSRLMCE
jgi:HAD superfamily hydrolase (TIGR01509 family)